MTDNTNQRPLFEVKNLRKSFPLGKTELHAVKDVNLKIFPGETLGLVGESGSGKSTLGKCLLRLLEPTSGTILFDGIDICHLTMPMMRQMRRRMQMIFQNPYGSLNPRMTIQEILAEAFDIHHLASGLKRKEAIQNLLQLVGLNPHTTDRYPHEFSGGQRQRIVLARALAVEPQFIVCDEPLSALDVSIQAQIINLLKDLQIKMKLTTLFITHDLSIMQYIADRVAVMYLGHLVELAPTQELYNNPLHPYTQELFSAILIADPKLARKRMQSIISEKPKIMDAEYHWQEVSPGHFVARSTT
jgi:peptide/nickel transport system ATP-binding protein/oligopeptide transport system ATP-binding protein